MKASEILRGLADLIDKASATSTDQTTSKFAPIQTPSGSDQTPTMVPPLQAKLEILKKSEGLPSVYDEEGQINDEIELMKQRAGLTPCQQEAAEDNDITG